MSNESFKRQFGDARSIAPSGWSIADNSDGTITVQGPGMGCIVSDVEANERRVPGEVLHALCRAMLTAAPTPPVQTAKRVFLVATGEVYEGRETYERYEDSPPPLCDYEVLYTRGDFVPAPAVPESADGGRAVPEDVARDAERYRWLREQDNDDFCFAVVKNPHFDVYEPGADLDAAIDAALSSEKEPTK